MRVRGTDIARWGAFASWAIALACAGEGGYGFSEGQGSADGATAASASAGDTEASTSEDEGAPRLDLGPGGATENDSADDPSDCDVQASIVPVEPTITLLVDQSGSMTEDFGGITRWQAVHDTLLDADTGVVAGLESEVRFGMTLYSATDGMFGGACPLLVEVPPDFDNRAAMEAAFGQPIVEGDTPTGESVAAAAMALAAVRDDTPKAIVLATDGEPDTCAVPDPQTGQPESLAAVQLAWELGIETFVISVGPELAVSHLQELANAGVGAEPGAQPGAPYFQALDAAELATAFDMLIGGFVSCTFAVDGIVDVAQACLGTVRLDGTLLECGTDWQLSDGSTLELQGSACDALRDGGAHTVDASFPCDVIDIP
ncbi:MAG: VWA domain-containing protein [Deltaproteobacteria bacterium]|nr:VWA domain-containing protein [Nannocystaceae bacterium]